MVGLFAALRRVYVRTTCCIARSRFAGIGAIGQEVGAIGTEVDTCLQVRPYHGKEEPPRTVSPRRQDNWEDAPRCKLAARRAQLEQGSGPGC